MLSWRGGTDEDEAAMLSSPGYYGIPGVCRVSSGNRFAEAFLIKGEKEEERMDCWGILGIGPTEDEGEVKRAYLEKLPEHHPEEDPEGFRQLRGAMEEALKQARLLRTEKEAGVASGLVRSEMLGREEIQDFLKQT